MSFESKKELIQHLLLGNKAVHVSTGVTIEIDQAGDLVFEGKSDSSVNADDYTQWIKSE